MYVEVGGYTEIEDGGEYLAIQTAINLVRGIELEKSVVLIKTFLTENKAYASYFYGELGLKKSTILQNFRTILQFSNAELNMLIAEFGSKFPKKPNNLKDLIDQFNQASPILQLEVTKNYLSSESDETVGSLTESFTDVEASFNKIHSVFGLYFASNLDFENESFKYIMSVLRYLLCRFYLINDKYMNGNAIDGFKPKMGEKLSGNSEFELYLQWSIGNAKEDADNFEFILYFEGIVEKYKSDPDLAFLYFEGILKMAELKLINLEYFIDLEDIMDKWNDKLKTLVEDFLETNPLEYLNAIHNFKNKTN